MRAVYPYSSRLFTIYSQKDKIDWVNQNQIKRFLVWYMPKKLVNGVNTASKTFHGPIISLGNGKSAYLFAASTPKSTPFTILTEHKNNQKYVGSLFDEDDLHQIEQTDSLSEIERQILEAKDGEPITIVCSTDPQRFDYWLKKILPKIPQHKRKDVIFFLPQSPNFAFDHLKTLGFTTILFDYYPGIGGAKHDAKTRVSEVTAGIKEEIFYTIANEENFATRRELLYDNLHHLSIGQELKREEDHMNFFLSPTNALLHLAGNITQIAKSLVGKKFDTSIMTTSSAEEFFTKFNSGIAGMRSSDIILEVGTSLRGKGFYREMPEIAADVLMQEASKEICQLVDLLQTRRLLAKSEFPHHSSDHLRSKYLRQWQIANDEDPRSVPFSTFIRRNPPYQNPQIVIPTREDGTLETQHRFYREEVETLRYIIGIGEIAGVKLPTLTSLAEFGEKMMGREASLDHRSGCKVQMATKLSEEEKQIKSKL